MQKWGESPKDTLLLDILLLQARGVAWQLDNGTGIKSCQLVMEAVLQI